VGVVLERVNLRFLVEAVSSRKLLSIN
jgi:hypothetical protein